MISSSTVTTILPVEDMERATGFYRDRLGLEDGGDVGGGNHLLRTSAGSTIELMTAEPGAQTGHTVMSFEVDDVAREISDLETRGVAFEDYDLPDLHTVDHVVTVGTDKAAWFKDSEGNVLCLHQRLSA
jgi:catechol 2,3-dioxygenase-like lactoylglutathione lyase family enzyme